MSKRRRARGDGRSVLHPADPWTPGPRWDAGAVALLALLGLPRVALVGYGVAAAPWAARGG